jgi:hypothetical protein
MNRRTFFIGAVSAAIASACRRKASNGEPDMLSLQHFVDTYRPSPDVQRADRELLFKYSKLVPASLLQLWEKVGFGSYGDGQIWIINPEEYNELLRGWLMLDEEDPTRIPLAISAFGHIFYYRRLTDTDEDISVINPHYSTGDVLTWSLDDFFNDYLCDAEAANEALQIALFQDAVSRYGPLEKGQMFIWTPAIRLGGSESVEHLTKGNALIHLDILLQLALGG